MTEVETEVNPLLKYEKAKRAGFVEKFKVNTSYGKFFFWIGTPQAKEEIITNMTHDYYDGPWMRELPVEIRMKLVKLKWADIGANTGWFAFKLVHRLMPKNVICLESSTYRFSFLRHNHMNNDRNNAIALMFKHVVAEKEYAVSTATIKLDPSTGLANVNGSEEVIVPVIAFSDLLRLYGINALKLNAGGYEKDILLNGDLSRIRIVLARIKKSDYTTKEYKKLKTRLKKEFETVLVNKTDTKGTSYFIAYRKEMIKLPS